MPPARRMPHILYFLVLLLAACAGSDHNTAVPRSAVPVSGIAFVQETGGERDIYLIQPDGTGLQQPIHSDAVDSDPAFSPDGRTLAFRSRRDGSSDIYLAAADGVGEWVNLVGDPEGSFDDEFYPRWHPGSQLLALYTDRFQLPIGGCTGNRGVHHLGLLSLDVARPQVEHFGDLAGHQETFSWSPYGRTLAISSACRQSNSGLYLWDRETREITTLTDENTYNATDPAFSPDGRMLAFTAYSESGADILLLDLETGEITNLTTSPSRDFQPTWSPDGQWIAFAISEPGNSDIFVIRIDGTGRRNLTNRPGQDILPNWSPWSSGGN